jgi:hypothetical protein
LGSGLGDGDGQHERQKGSGRPGRRLRGHDPDVEHDKPGHGHCNDGGHFVRRDQRAQRDEPAPDAEQGAVTAEPGRERPRVVHKQKERERSKGGEEADLRIGERDVRQAEHTGHEDGRAHRALHGQEVRVLGADPRARRSRKTTMHSGRRGDDVGHRESMEGSSQECSLPSNGVM